MAVHGQPADNHDREILIAEDSPTQAEQLKHLLEAHGYVVSTAPNGKQALDSARNHKPTLIISDIVMPEMDGYALCKAVKSDQHLRDVPVIIVTTLSSIQDIVTGLECGADNFIRKPYDPKTLLARIDNLLSNWELRRGNKMRMGLEIFLGGNKHFITSEREQILDLLISSYEQAIQVNEELKLREQEVNMLNGDLEQHAAELEAANKELESFSYSVSHDLRAPLRAIDGFSRILEDDYGPTLDDEGRRLLKTVRDNTVRMAQLIEDLLEFSRWGRQPLASAEVDMTALAREVFGEMETARNGVPLACTFEALPAAYGDRSLIRQVWINLLSNAVKYSGGRAAPQISVSGYSEDVQSVYCVQDNGAGFDMTYYDKLFGVFQRLHRAEEFPGTGVGLAIVRRVVLKHGGRVWAQGKVDEGASFYFSLPAGRRERTV
jgi:two-component system, sensor histidine kinase and response regulator